MLSMTGFRNRSGCRPVRADIMWPTARAVGLEFLHFFVRCLVKYVYHINFSLDRPTLIAYLLPESQL